MRILILGMTGMLGHRLVRELATGHEVAATLRGEVPPALGDVKSKLFRAHAGDLEGIAKILAEFKPDAVVNCIGLIKQKEESRDEEQAMAVNARFPHLLHALCKNAGARLVQMSTDCVFSGSKHAPYTEEDIPDPPDLYGRSKLQGEVAGEGAVTLRTSIIGRELGTDYSLLEWAISQKGKTVKGYAGALYSGLTTLEMARVIRMVLEKHPGLSGVYHVAGEAISKYALLGLINRYLELDLTIEKEEFFKMDRRLDASRFNARTGYVPPTWEQMVKELAWQ